MIYVYLHVGMCMRVHVPMEASDQRLWNPLETGVIVSCELLGVGAGN